MLPMLSIDYKTANEQLIVIKNFKEAMNEQFKIIFAEAYYRKARHDYDAFTDELKIHIEVMKRTAASISSASAAAPPSNLMDM